MPLGLFKKVGKYPGTGDLGAEPPAGSMGSALVGVQGGEARAFSQSELPRKPPIDTHGKGGGGSRNSDKSRKNSIPDHIEKYQIIHSCYYSCCRMTVENNFVVRLCNT